MHVLWDSTSLLFLICSVTFYQFIANFFHPWMLQFFEIMRLTVLKWWWGVSVSSESNIGVKCIMSSSSFNIFRLIKYIVEWFWKCRHCSQLNCIMLTQWPHHTQEEKKQYLKGNKSKKKEKNKVKQQISQLSKIFLPLASYTISHSQNKFLFLYYFNKD